MEEFKRGTLHSGKKGPVVKSSQQAKAIAQSMCFTDCECGGDCDRCKKKKSMVALGYSEKAAEVIAESAYPRPTPTATEFSEDQTIGMVRNRLRVMHARISEIEEAIEMAMATGGEIEIEPWMVDKITLSADYISATADNARYGDGIKVEMEDEEEEEEEGDGETGEGEGGEGEYSLSYL
jgi:hypothetical protein